MAMDYTRQMGSLAELVRALDQPVEVLRLVNLYPAPPILLTGNIYTSIYRHTRSTGIHAAQAYTQHRQSQRPY